MCMTWLSIKCAYFDTETTGRSSTGVENYTLYKLKKSGKLCKLNIFDVYNYINHSIYMRGIS